MKRKFLAKAITLGLMLAVPLGAQAADNLKYAQGIVINNVDSKTVGDVNGDVNLSLDIPVTNFANLNNNIDYIVGIANVTGDNSIVMDSANISNTNFVTNAKQAEIAGIFNLQGRTTINKDVNIKLSGEDKNETPGLGIFGIRTFWHTRYNEESGKYEPDKDDKISKISIAGNTKIDISGKAAYLAGILLQDNEGTELTLGENTDIKVTDTSKNGSENLYGINLPFMDQATKKSEIKGNNIKIELNGGMKQLGFSGANGDVEIRDLDIRLNDASVEAKGISVGESYSSHYCTTKIGNLSIYIANSAKDKKENFSAIVLSCNNSLTVSGNVKLDVENGYAIKTGFWSNKQYLNNDLALGNDDGSKTVQIKGDILSSEDGSGTIKLNLNNSNSYFTGTNTGKTDIVLKDGAAWTNTGASTVTNLDINGATLVQGSADAAITKFTKNNPNNSHRQFTIAGNNTIALNTTSDGSTMKSTKNLFAEDAFDTVDENTTIKLTSANQNASNIIK